MLAGDLIGRRDGLIQILRNQNISIIFQRLFQADTSIRSRENPVKTMYAKSLKVDKVLAEVNGKVNMSDVEGKGCLFRYLVERLKKENSK